MSRFFRITGSFSAMSMIGALAVILTYLAMPDLRRHPTNMVFYLSLCDFFLSFKFLVTSLYPHSERLETKDVSCYLQAGWMQFWGVGSIAWNGMISLNLIINLQKQGFAKTSNLGKYYHMFVWGLATLTTVVMYSVPGHHIGPSGDGTCWISNNFLDPLRLLFFVPLIIFFAMSISSLVLSFLRTQHVSGLSDNSRRGVILRMISYTGVFLLCWSGPVAHRIYLLSHKNVNESVDNPSRLMYLDASGICIQGFANSMVWLTNPSFFTSFRHKIVSRYFSWLLPSQEQAPLLYTLQDTLQDSKQDINRIDTLLRKNIITCLLLGIRSSLKEPAYNTEVTPKSYVEERIYDYDKLYTIEQEPAFEKSMGYDFIDFAPFIFSRLRAEYGISPQKYMEAMSPSSFLGELNDQLQKFSEGRSNSFFIFSPNKQFIVKTLAVEEAKLLSKILPNLYQYFLANSTTLLPRFHGFHGVRVPHGEIVYVVVMGNVFCSPYPIHEQYDLKGSWVNRYAGMDKHAEAGKTKSGMDVDFKRKLKLQLPRQNQLLDQLSKDAFFLCSLNIMDFSLLLGIHFLDNNNNGNKSNINNVTSDIVRDNVEMAELAPSYRRGSGSATQSSLLVHTASDFSAVYFMGVIDILQLYNTRKKTERFMKVYLLRKDKAGLSAMPPEAYARRFINAMERMMV